MELSSSDSSSCGDYLEKDEKEKKVLWRWSPPELANHLLEQPRDAQQVITMYISGILDAHFEVKKK